MGQGISSFRPYDTVSRAEFGTVLSRAIWGDDNNGSTPFYAAHLNALKRAGIMTMIDNPENMKEIRGYVMIMLMRADMDYLDGGSNICKDPLIMLACALDTPDCPAQCKDDGETIERPEAKGNLDVSVLDHSTSIRSVPMQGTVIFNSIRFNSSESVTVYSINLERFGLSNRQTARAVWFEKDGVAVSSRGSVSSDGTVSLNFNRGFVVKSNETLDLVVELNDTQAGSEIAFRFTGVDSSAKNVTFRAETSMYRTANYQVAELTFDGSLAGSGTEYRLGTQRDFTFGQFSLSNSVPGGDDRIVEVRSITLRNNGSADLNNLLTNVRIMRDNTNVATNVIINGRDMTISFRDEIAGGRRATYIIVAEINLLDRVGDTVQLELRRNTDLVAYEKSTGFRTNNNPANGGPLALYIMQGGRVSFANDATQARTVDAGPGASDVVIASGSITLAESIKLGQSVFTGASGVINNLVIEVGGSRYTANKTTTGNVDTFTFDEIFVNRTSSVRMFASILNNATIGSGVRLTPVNIQGTAFANGEYLDNQEILQNNTIAGAIQIAQVNVRVPQFSLRNTASTTQRVVAGETANRVIFDGEIVSNRGNIMVNELVLTGPAVGIAGSQIDLFVSIDGTNYGFANWRPGTPITFNSLGTVGATAKKVIIEASVTSTAGNTGNIIFDVQARGTDTNGNQSVSSLARTVTLSIVDSASITIANQNAVSSVVVEGSNAELTRFTTTVRDGTVVINTVTLTGDFTGLTSATLQIGNDTFESDYPMVNTGTLTFSNMNESMSDGSANFIFTTNINTDGMTTGMLLKVSGVTLTLDGAAPVSRTLNATYLVTKGFPVLSRISDSNNRLVFRITNSSSEPITIVNSDIVYAGAGAGAGVLNGQLDPTFSVTLDPGQAVEAEVPVTSGTVSVSSVKYSIVEAGITYTYTLTNQYANVARWGDLQATFRS